MQILRALLNSGVFMVLLVVGVSVYLAYSEQIHSTLGQIDVASVISGDDKVAEAPVVDAAKKDNAVSTSSAPVVASVAAPAPAPAAVATMPEQASVAPSALQVPSAAVVDAAPSANAAPISWPTPSPMPEMPAMQPMAELPPMPEMPPMQPMAELPPMPEMPPMQPMAELPPMPEMPAMQPMPEFPAMPVMSMQAPVSAPVSPVIPAPSVDASTALLDEARAAYIAGNLDLAEAKYRMVLAKSEDPDAYGELGNVFFARQQFDQANTAYLKAAEGLIAQNRLLQAQYVIGILMQSQPEFAQKAMQAFNAKLQVVNP